MINDLKTTRVNEVKLVNYLTTLETVPKFGPSNIQDAVSGIQEWSESNCFQIREKTCEEMQIDVSKNLNISPSPKLSKWKATRN